MAQLPTDRTYDPKTGRLLTIQSGGGAAQDLSYTYDVLGNMTSRRDRTGAQLYGSRRDLREQFAYDGLQRLTTSTVTTGLAMPPSLALTYDAEGNIQTRSVGGVSSTYAYGRTVPGSCGNTAVPGPHAVTQAGSMKYCYDASGNVIKTLDTSGLRTFAYTSYDLRRDALRGLGGDPRDRRGDQRGAPLPGRGAAGAAQERGDHDDRAAVRPDRRAGLDVRGAERLGRTGPHQRDCGDRRPGRRRQYPQSRPLRQNSRRPTGRCGGDGDESIFIREKPCRHRKA